MELELPKSCQRREPFIILNQHNIVIASNIVLYIHVLNRKSGEVHIMCGQDTSSSKSMNQPVQHTAIYQELRGQYPLVQHTTISQELRGQYPLLVSEVHFTANSSTKSSIANGNGSKKRVLAIHVSPEKQCVLPSWYATHLSVDILWITTYINVIAK